MIFSVRNKFNGGFDYFEVPDSVPVNDDHPAPRLGTLRTKLGIPATQAGRPLPSGARAVGSGQYPVGSMSSGKAGIWPSGGGLPSGLGLGSFDLPCPDSRQSAVIGAVLGTIVHLYTGDEEEDVARGLMLLTVGGVFGYFFGNQLCFWR